MSEIIGNTVATPNPYPDWSNIENKPEILTEDEVKYLIDEFGGDTQIQADWEQKNNTAKDYIKNKPNILTEDDIKGLIDEFGGSGADGLAIEDYGGFKRLFLMDGENKLGNGVLLPQGGGTISNVGLESEIDEKGRKYLYLTVDGTRVGEGILLPQGGGGGGGGSTNSAEMLLENITGWLSKDVAEGANCELSVNWSSVENGMSTGKGTLMVYVNEVVKTAYDVEQGNVSVNVKKYLKTGTNIVVLSVSDCYGNTLTTQFIITVVSVSLTSTFVGSTPRTGSIDYWYVPDGGGVLATAYFLIDGDQIHEEPIVADGASKPYRIPAQSHGHHKFEVYFVGDVDGTFVPSETLRYDLICYEENNTTPIIAIPFYETKIKQYDTITIPYSVYTGGSPKSNVELKENGITIKTEEVDRTQQSWLYKAQTSGNVKLSIVCGGVARDIEFEVELSDITASAVSDNLQLYLSCVGRSNTEPHPEVWESQGEAEVSAILSNFNFVSDGWKSDGGSPVLRVTGDARVEIPYTIFKDTKTKGRTIEIEFATRDVLNYESTIISSWSGDRGIEITAQKARLKSLGREVFTQYKENETVRVSFVIENENKHRLMSIYVNGVMSNVKQYDDSDVFDHLGQVGLSIGSNYCTTDIYSIRIYDTDLTRREILKNWIADTQNAELMKERYIRNNIFDSYNKISINELPSYVPYMILNVPTYADLPQGAEEVKTISGIYVDRTNPERSFTFQDADIKIQGTTSIDYPRKNYRITFKNGFVVNNVPSSTYKLRSTSMPTNEFTFKADYASSEGVNNVELVRLYDDLCPVKTPPQEKDYRVRQGIEGYPILMFYGTGDNILFLGKYNFNNDKSTPEVFGFSTGDESWEIRTNNTELARWRDDDFSEWQATFEARYPKKNTNITNLQEFASWLTSTDTMANGLTETEKERRLQKFKDEFANYANVDAMIFNYVFTEAFLMVDNRAKNAFPTRFHEDGESERWLILPYDMDTAIGINNEGELKFGYELEDTDLINDHFVYNGQDSVLYVNMRLGFADKIKETYQTLRNDGIFSYKEVERRFDEHQKIWGEAVFNEDSQFKYIDPFINNNIDYLHMLQGSKAEQRKWWLYNRFKYLDSKYSTGDAMKDTVQMRSYGVSDVEVTSYADIYAEVQFDDFVSKERCLKGQKVTLKNKLTGKTDADVTICSVSQLSSVGDLSALKIGVVDFSRAIRLTSLKIGDKTAGYENPNIEKLTVGNLTLLRTLDVRNCINLGESIDVRGCTNIEHIYCEGTIIPSVSLPNGGILKTLHLPSTVHTLVILNQRQLSDFELDRSAKLKILRLENINFQIINPLQLINQLDTTESSVRLFGIDWQFDNEDELTTVLNKLDNSRGLDENGAASNYYPNAVLEGKIYVPSITSDTLDFIKTKYPYLRVEYDTLQVKVRFLNYDDTELKSQDLNPGAAIIPPIDPIRPDTDEWDYIFEGWTLNGELVKDFGVVGTSSVTYKAQYEAVRRKYIIKFYNGAELLQESEVEYGTMPQYNGTTPVNPNDGGDFTGWDPELAPVTGDATYNAQFAVKVRFLSDGVLIDEQTLAPGDPITLPTNPQRPSTAQYNYTFKGWSRDGVNVEEVGTIGSTNITYRAVFDELLRKYKVRFVNGSAPPVEIEVAYGTTPVYPNGTPSNTNGEGAFLGWQPALQAVAGDITYSAQYYTVIKFYSDNAVIATYSVVPGENIPIPADPTKEDVGVYFYRFKGWSTDGANVTTIGVAGTRDTYYYAVFDQLTKVTVKFYNGNTLLSEKLYVTGETIVRPTNPTKESTVQYTYTFKGWSTDQTNVVPVGTAGHNDVSYYAVFTSNLRYYEIRFLNSNGTVLETQRLPYGYMPAYTGSTPVDPGGSNDQFSGWVPKLAAVTGNADYVAEFRSDLIYTLSSDGSSYWVDEVADYTCTDVVIPSTYKGKPVTRIKNYVFAGCNRLTSVVIGDNVTSIGEEAFQYCESLVTVEIGKSVTSIDVFAFEGCYNLVEVINRSSLNIQAGSHDYGGVARYAKEVHSGTSKIVNLGDYLFYTYEEVNYLLGYVGDDTKLTLPESYNGENYEIYNDVFQNCTSLTSIVIPDSVTRIGSSAFSSCSSLTSVVIGDSVTSIGYNAFYGCSSLTSVVIGDSVTSIGSSVFQDCTSLTSIEIPDSVTSIGEYAFHSCTNLTSVIIGDGVTRLAESMFVCCSNLSNVVIGNGVTSIGDWVFTECTSLTNIEFPESLTSIGEDVFSACINLKTITMYKNLMSIESGAFYDCNITDVYYYGKQGDWESIRVEDYNDGLLNATIHFIPFSEGLAYELNDDGQSYSVTGIGTCEDTEIVISSKYNGKPVTSIGSKAFYTLSSLTSVVIPNSVTSIGNDAFHSCSNLTSVVIGNSVTSIGNYAFRGCGKLTNIAIPDSITSIGKDAFFACTILRGVYISKIVKWCEIRFNSEYSNPLYYAHRLYLNEILVTDLEIPDGTTSIGNYAFYNCTSLTSVVIPDSVTSIGYRAFYGCSSFTSIEIPDSITSIGEYAFYGCSSLTSIVIPDSVTSIGDSAFRECRSLTSIEIPDSVTSIGGSAFLGCSRLTSITIPSGVTNIGSSTFDSCSSLTSVVIGDSVTSIGDRAFRVCTSLTSVVIPDSVTYIGEYAFYGCSSLTDVYYTGSQDQWNEISVDESNSYLTNARITYNYTLTTYTLRRLADFEYISNGNATCYIGSIGTYTDSNIIIPETSPDGDIVTGIGNSAFRNCASIVSVEIPNSVTNIGYGAFAGCSSLANITIPDSVTSVGDRTFRGCTALISAIIGNNITKITPRMFENCSHLTSIRIPYNILTVGEYAFNNCTLLATATFDGVPTSIDSTAFAGTGAILTINVPWSTDYVANAPWGATASTINYNCIEE